jgi:hypothetical protein
MIKSTGKNIVAKQDANTRDIMSALVVAVPGAAKNLNTFAKNFYKGNDQEYIKKIVSTLRERVKYKKDSFLNQNIKFPGRLLNDGQGDCKSLSLFAAGAMSAAGIKNGFRFAAYRPGAPTHVYNYYINAKGDKIPFDLCINNLGETNSLKKIDMNVNYLAQPEIGRGKIKRFFKQAKENREERQEIRRENREEKKSMTKEERRAAKKAGKGDKKRPIKTVFLAPGRTAFLELVKLNFRGLANKLQTLETKSPGQPKAFWNRLGGNYNKLEKAISLGATRRAFLGNPEEFTERAITRENKIVKAYVPKFKNARNLSRFISAAPPAPPIDPATLSALIGSAVAIIKPLMTLLKNKKIEDNDTKELEESEEVKSAEALGANFAVKDAEPGTEKESSGSSESSAGGLSNIFSNPLLLVGGGLALYLAFKPKK